MMEVDRNNENNELFTMAMGKGVWIDDDPVKVQAALDNGFNPNYYDNDGATTLHRAAGAGCVKALEVFLQNDITRIDLKDHLHRTPLHYVAECKVFDKAKKICHMLIEAGLAIDSECNDSFYPTALFYCIKHMNTKLAAYLLEVGADIDIVNFYSCTPLLALLIESGVGYSHEEYLEMLHVLLYYNVDVNAPDSKHPLLMGISNRKKDVVLSLLDYSISHKHLQGYCCPAVDWNQCLDMNFINDLFVLNIGVDLIMSIVNEFHCEYQMHEIYINMMLCSGRFSDLQLFNFCYDKVSSRCWGGKTFGCLYRLFNNWSLDKHDFLTAVEKVFDDDFGILWESHAVSECLPLLLGPLRTDLLLTTEEVMSVFYQMYKFLDGLCWNIVRVVFKVTTFSDEFEALLRLNPRIYEDSVCKLGKYVDCTNYAYLCMIRKPYPIRRYGEQSLQSLSRNVVRNQIWKSISPIPKYSLNFSFYNKLIKIDAPKKILDILTLKTLLPEDNFKYINTRYYD